MALTLTMLQRLRVMALIRECRAKEDDVLDLLLDIKRKISPTPEELKSILIPRPADGVMEINMVVANTWELLSVELEKAELRKIRTLLIDFRSTQGLTVDDVDWFRPLLADIDLLLK